MVNFLHSIWKNLHRAEKIYTGAACGACNKYQVWWYEGNSGIRLNGFDMPCLRNTALRRSRSHFHCKSKNVFSAEVQMLTSKDASTLRVASSDSCKAGWSGSWSQGREMPFLSTAGGRWQPAAGARCSQGRESGQETKWSDLTPPRHPTWLSKLSVMYFWEPYCLTRSQASKLR